MSKTGEKAGDHNLPAPIILYAIDDIGPILDLLQDVVGDKYLMKLLANDQVEIQLKDEDKIEALTDALRSNDIIFQIKEKKKEEKFKVVLRNMHPSISVESLTRELEAHGHKVISISNLKDATTKEPMPLFSVELEPKENNEDIYEVTKLSNMIIAFEPQNQEKKFPECFRCQTIDEKEGSNAEMPNDTPPQSPTATSKPISTSTTSTPPTETPIAYVQPIRSRGSKNRRSNQPTSSNSHTPQAPTPEQIATLNRLRNLESIVNSTISSLESMFILTSSLNQRLNSA